MRSFWDSQVAWYENLNGSGVFGPKIILGAGGAGADSFGLGDVDGDGDLDVMAILAYPSPPGFRRVFWYENKLETITGVESLEAPVSTAISDLSNYPNPFRGATTISYTVEKSGFISLGIFDVLGRRVATLVDEVAAAGAHQVDFDASALSSGTYLYRLTTGGRTIIKSLTLVK